MAFAVWMFRSLRTTPPIHSPIGIIFTGLIEVVASTITSMSVCALVGFKITMLPWYAQLGFSQKYADVVSRSVFPLIIMFIGAETMSNLVS
jgi:hypothetical protein